MRITTMLAAGAAFLSSHLGAAQGIYYLDAPTARGTLAPGPAYIARVVDARGQRASLGGVSRGQVLPLPATGPTVYLPVTPTAEAPTYLECRTTAPEPLRQVKDATGAAALNRLVK